MALHDERNGAIAPTLLPFRRTKSRDDAELPEYTKLLGTIYDMHDGVSATLVRANVTIPKQALNASYALFGVSNALRTVALTTGGETIAGYTFPGQDEVLAGHLFFMLIPTAGEGRISVVAEDASVVAGGTFLTAGAGGNVVTAVHDPLPGVTPLKTLAAIAIGEVGDVMASGNTVF